METFAVYLFFPDGSYHRERADLDAAGAVRLAKHCTMRPAALAGLIQRIIITDDGDNTCFQWEYGKGLTFPARKE